MSNEPLRTIDGIAVYDDINTAVKNGAALSTKPLHRGIASMPCIVAHGAHMPYGAQRDDLERVLGKAYESMVGAAVVNAQLLMKRHDIARCYLVVEDQKTVMATTAVWGSIMAGKGGFYGGTLDGIAAAVKFQKGSMLMKLSYTLVPCEPAAAGNTP
jgi:hypothetical protein